MSGHGKSKGGDLCAESIKEFTFKILQTPVLLPSDGLSQTGPLLLLNVPVSTTPLMSDLNLRETQ
jgi:hypothetical protein